jgi:hypothetical protein
MIYRGSGFLALGRFGSFLLPPPLSRQQVVSLSQSACVSPRQSGLMTGEGGGAKSYGDEKAWAHIRGHYWSAKKDDISL